MTAPAVPCRYLLTADEIFLAATEEAARTPPTPGAARRLARHFRIEDFQQAQEAPAAPQLRDLRRRAS